MKERVVLRNSKVIIFPDVVVCSQVFIILTCITGFIFYVELNYVAASFGWLFYVALLLFDILLMTGVSIVRYFDLKSSVFSVSYAGLWERYICTISSIDHVLYQKNVGPENYEVEGSSQLFVVLGNNKKISVGRYSMVDGAFIDGKKLAKYIGVPYLNK